MVVASQSFAVAVRVPPRWPPVTVAPSPEPEHLWRAKLKWMVIADVPPCVNAGVKVARPASLQLLMLPVPSMPAGLAAWAGVAANDATANIATATALNVALIGVNSPFGDWI